MTKLRVGLLFGGRSVEHEVSIASATSIWGALDTTRYEILPIAIASVILIFWALLFLLLRHICLRRSLVGQKA